MYPEEYHELRRHIRNELGVLIENAPDKECFGCIWFDFYFTKAGAPENPNYAKCNQYGISLESNQNPNLVKRHIICLLDNRKEIE